MGLHGLRRLSHHYCLALLTGDARAGTLCKQTRGFYTEALALGHSLSLPAKGEVLLAASTWMTLAPRSDQWRLYLSLISLWFTPSWSAVFCVWLTFVHMRLGFFRTDSSFHKGWFANKIVTCFLGLDFIARQGQNVNSLFIASGIWGLLLSLLGPYTVPLIIDWGS